MKPRINTTIVGRSVAPSSTTVFRRMNLLLTLLAIMALLEQWVPAATHFRTLRSFGYADQLSFHPHGGLVQGSDGAFYGITGDANPSGFFRHPPGTVFRVNSDGSGFRVLLRFSNVPFRQTPDQLPNSEAWLIEGSDGVLYGTTHSGGRTDEPCSQNGAGTVFRLHKDGSGYAVLHLFAPPPCFFFASRPTDRTADRLVEEIPRDGSFPAAALVEASNGILYGTTVAGGGSNGGTVFKLRRLCKIT